MSLLPRAVWASRGGAGVRLVALRVALDGSDSGSSVQSLAARCPSRLLRKGVPRPRSETDCAACRLECRPVVAANANGGGGAAGDVPPVRGAEPSRRCGAGSVGARGPLAGAGG